jgi:DNA-binding NarL/FixJ family response regulator
LFSVSARLVGSAGAALNAAGPFAWACEFLQRVAESRAPLRAAREAFDALVMLPWAERARHELRAAGVASRPRERVAMDELTPQELQIALMAASGLSNREIGRQLYLSHRTVGAHLYRAFPKLGITSRGQLRDALDNTLP